MEKSDYIQIVKTTASNFTYKEMMHSATAIRYGINNTPNDEQWDCIEDLVQYILQPVRLQFGSIKITSGFRTKELCVKIGSSTSSNHARGQAADIEPVNTSIKLYDVMEWIYHNCEFREIIAEYFPNGWIHVAYREGANNRQIKLKDKDHHYHRCDLDYIKSIYG